MGGHLESGMLGNGDQRLAMSSTPGNGEEFNPELIDSFGAMTLNEIQSHVNTFSKGNG